MQQNQNNNNNANNLEEAKNDQNIADATGLVDPQDQKDEPLEVQSYRSNKNSDVMFNPQDMPGQNELGNLTAESEDEKKDETQNAEAQFSDQQFNLPQIDGRRNPQLISINDEPVIEPAIVN